MKKTLLLSLALIGTLFVRSQADIRRLNQPVSGGPISPTAVECDGTGTLEFDSTTLVVDCTNNRVGFGTASPEEALHARVDEVRFDNLGQHELTWGNANIEFFQFISGTSGGTILNNKTSPHGGGYISIPTGGAATMALMPTSGSVGIGTASPDSGSKLDVAGQAVIGNAATKSTATATGHVQAQKICAGLGCSTSATGVAVSASSGTAIFKFGSITLADTDTYSIGTDFGTLGRLDLVIGTDDSLCSFAILGNSNTVVEIFDHASICSTTGATGSSLNVSSAGGGAYTLTNNRGGARTVSVKFAGF